MIQYFEDICLIGQILMIVQQQFKNAFDQVVLNQVQSICFLEFIMSQCVLSTLQFHRHELILCHFECGEDASTMQHNILQRDDRLGVADHALLHHAPGLGKRQLYHTDVLAMLCQTASGAHPCAV